MKPLSAFETLVDRARGQTLDLPPALARIYGPLRMPGLAGRPYVVGNVAATLDGVVALGRTGTSGGGDITGFEPHDRLLMGLLRASADAVVVGAGTFRAVPRHVWTAEHVDPSRARSYQEFRRRLGKPPSPLNVVVTASGNVDLRLPLFSSGEVPVLIVTNRAGARRLPRETWPSTVRVVSTRPAGRITAAAVLRSIGSATSAGLILVEGGPQLLGDFFAEKRLDELFLTLAPQIAGRRDPLARPGLVAGRTFAPERPVWGTLAGIRRADNLLFLRYTFGSPARPRASVVAPH
ncbi:MAG: dihydrofolate reductase family protein [Thermoplasmata archaeon]|nr:dihydrofolate reductase family protein [Thermoplasmata archaeon]